MRRVYKLLMVICCITFIDGCTKDNFWYSGISDGHFDGNLLEYMESSGHSYDWDSTALMVRHAGADVIQLFEGKDPAHKEITFLGPTNNSIRRYMLNNGIKRVKDMDPEFCKKMLLRHVIDGKIYRDDIQEGKPLSGGAVIGDGGDTYTALGGNRIWIYSHAEAYEKIEGIGAVSLRILSVDESRFIDVASTNIEPEGCVVHSLHYSYTLGDM